MNEANPFVISQFTNPSGEIVFRVGGRIDGKRIRRNFKTRADAEAERRLLKVQRLQGDAGIRTAITRLTDEQLLWSHGEPRLSILVSTWVQRQYSARNEKVQRQLRSNLVRFLFDHRDSTRLVSSWLGRFYAQCLIDPLNHEPSLRDEREAFNQLVKACGDDGPLRVSTIADFAGIGMDQGKLPRWTVSTEEAKREPRRLFYVGLTRAKREIRLTYSGWYETRYGTRKAQGPSEFVVGLRAKLRDVTGD